MGGDGLESNGVAFAALSLAPTPGCGMAAPDEPPIAWPDHPLAASGGEILAARILPLMGHNARDFARAAAVCRGWRAACRAATPTLSLYRETALQSILLETDVNVAWSPCGKCVVTTILRPPRVFIWRASTGALVNEWALATPATAVPRDILITADNIVVAFSRDSTQLVTLFGHSDHFAVWSVPDGQLLAVNRGDPDGETYSYADLGVPGSASDGLVIFGTVEGNIHFWDVPPPAEAGGSRPRLRCRVDLPLGGNPLTDSFSFSPNGSKFVVTCHRIAYVYDMASLTRLGAYTSPSYSPMAEWAPDGRNVLVSWGTSACVWDFSRPEAPAVVTVDVGPGARLSLWSPGRSAYFITRKLEGNAPNGHLTYALEERRAADGSLVRAVSLGPRDCFPHVRMSPDAHALLVSGGVPARVVVVD